jgi:hypothetical protein
MNQFMYSTSGSVDEAMVAGPVIDHYCGIMVRDLASLLVSTHYSRKHIGAISV